jgi:hypothetical protein
VGGTWALGDTSPVLWTRADTNVTSAGSPALVSAWGDVRDGVDYEWAQANEVYQPHVSADARGALLAFSAVTTETMECHELAALGQGAATIAIACEISGAAAAVQGVVAFGNSSTGLAMRLLRYTSPDRVVWERYNDASQTASIPVANPAPFAGTLVARYTGTALRLIANGAALSDVAFTGALTTDRLMLGSTNGVNYFLTANVREVAVWDRALTDPEAAAVDASLRAAWGY